MALDWVALAELGDMMVSVGCCPDHSEQDEQDTCHAQVHLEKPNLGKTQVVYEEHFSALIQIQLYLSVMNVGTCKDH